ncbi:MAG: DUF1223 domain-containing protein [Pseudoprimorskyibacter sp.]|jgi:hypothetical protein|nr:DUF1223 domain-containing protein [Pseudoprimorskyibacter sp.]
MRALLCKIIIAWFGLAGWGQAQSPVVIELFTSQGCASCPAADNLLAQLGLRDDVIPLALHVDYWDYIGWKDTYAQHAFTRRQKAYARVSQRNVIFTPQMIVNGTNAGAGNRPLEMAEMLIAAKFEAPKATLQIARDAETLTVMAEALVELGAAEIHIIRYIPEQIQKITHGENAGLNQKYTHIVTDWVTPGAWDGVGQYRQDFEVTGDAPIVVLLQGERFGAIFAAAQLK